MNDLSGKTVAACSTLRSPLAMLPDRLASVMSLTVPVEVPIGANMRIEGASGDARPVAPLFTRRGDTAIVPLMGMLAKYPSWLFYFVRGTSTLQFAQAVEAATNDPTVGTIVVPVDSGGGELSGSFEAADALYDAGKRKRTIAVISDLGASAAFLIASQAQNVVLNSSGLCGGIGVFVVLADYSGLYEQQGVRVHVVKPEEAWAKGIGVEGTPVTADHVAEVRRLVTAQHVLMVKTIARGRRNIPADRLRSLGTGQVFTASESLRNGLVDRLTGMSAAFAELDQEYADRTARIRAEVDAERERIEAESVRMAAVVARRKQLDDEAREREQKQWREDETKACAAAKLKRLRRQPGYLGCGL